MFKRTVLLMLFAYAALTMFAFEYDWGVKYGAGVSSAFGDDARYTLHYDIRTVDSSVSQLGYLEVDSRKAASGFSQSLGAYMEFMLAKKVDSVWLQPELHWQRYNFAYEFTGSTLNTDNLILAAAFADTLEGHIKQTLDYLTIPVLFKLKQESMVTSDGEHFNGAYIYMGPSFSILLNNQTRSYKGIKALENDITDFVNASYTDANPAQAYSSTKTESAGEKVLFHKLDFVVGMGFNLKNVFKMGICKDELSLDVRANMGMYPIGNAATRTEFKLYSVIFALGMKL